VAWRHDEGDRQDTYEVRVDPELAWLVREILEPFVVEYALPSLQEYAVDSGRSADWLDTPQAAAYFSAIRAQWVAMYRDMVAAVRTLATAGV
jgi:hypothetical protein